jgi:hypothetical protein
MTVWEDRDLPVLRWLNENPPENNILETDRLSDAPQPELPELTMQEVHESVETLADAGYISYENEMWEGGRAKLRTGFQVAGAGKQVLGQWPVFAALGEPERLAAVLERIAQMAPTEEAENLRGAAEGVSRFSSEALRSFAAGAIAALARRTFE